jgi:hypothetical protein
MRFKPFKSFNRYAPFKPLKLTSRFHPFQYAVLELVLAVAADTGVWNSKYVTRTRAAEK